MKKRVVTIISSVVLSVVAFLNGFYFLFAIELFSEILNIITFNSTKNVTENT